MSSIDSFIQAIDIVINWPTIGWILLGVLFGIFVGALPGLGGPVALAIALPLTYPLQPENAIILLVSIYIGTMFGGSISAILLNTPGTPGAAATTFDGYPMSRAGQATTALAIAATASAVSGIFTVITLILITPILIEVVLAFGAPEYFLVAIFGLTMITLVSQGSMVKGLTVGFLGLLLSTIGYAPMQPDLRYTFGMFELYDGISYIAALIGLFAISEMINLVGEGKTIARNNPEISGSISAGIKEVLKHPILLFKSGYIGWGVGAIPGAGASVSNFVSYSEAMRSSSNSEKFGNGDPRGVIAAEAANNATVAGSLIPTLTFGIPGSGATAVLLGGLLIHGLEPGPVLLTSELSSTYAIFISLIVGSIIIWVVGVSLITRMSYITKIDTNYIIPIIIILSLLAGLAVRSNWVDVITVVIFGLLGYLMKKQNYSIIAFVLGIILGPIAEENLFRSLQISDGSLMIFVSRPISILLLLLIFSTIFGGYIKKNIRDYLPSYGK